MRAYVPKSMYVLTVKCAKLEEIISCRKNNLYEGWPRRTSVRPGYFLWVGDV